MPTYLYCVRLAHWAEVRPAFMVHQGSKPWAQHVLGTLIGSELRPDCVCLGPIFLTHTRQSQISGQMGRSWKAVRAVVLKHLFSEAPSFSPCLFLLQVHMVFSDCLASWGCCSDYHFWNVPLTFLILLMTKVIMKQYHDWQWCPISPWLHTRAHLSTPRGHAWIFC